MENKFTKKMWFSTCLFSFMGGIAWNIENMYFNTFLYNSVYAGASTTAMSGTMAPTTAISRMVGLSAIAAVISTFIMGTLSDKMKNRKLFISAGYLVWGLVTAAFGFITRDNVSALLNISDETKILATTVWAVILMDIVMTFMGSASNDAAFNAWVTDVTNPKIRPTVETVLTFVGFLSMAAVMGVGSFAQSGAVSYKNFFLILGLVVSLCGVAGFFLIDNPKQISAENEVSSSYWSDLFYGFRPSVIKENSRLYLTLTALGSFSVAFQVFFPYLLVYLQYVVIPDNTANGASLLSTSTIIVAVVAVAALVAGIVLLLKLAGKDKGKGLVIGVIAMTVGLIILSTTTNIKGVLLGVAPTAIGYVVLGILFNASVKDFIPEGKAGLFLGIRMIFFVLIPMVLGPAIGDIACLKSSITYINEYNVETIVPAKSMFLYAAIVSALTLVPLFILIKRGVFKREQEN